MECLGLGPYHVPHSMSRCQAQQGEDPGSTALCLSLDSFCHQYNALNLPTIWSYSEQRFEITQRDSLDKYRPTTLHCPGPISSMIYVGHPLMMRTPLTLPSTRHTVRMSNRKAPSFQLSIRYLQNRHINSLLRLRCLNFHVLLLQIYLNLSLILRGYFGSCYTDCG